MLVRMKQKIGGSREGEEWPDVGETLELADHQAADLIANGYAEEATGEGPAKQTAEDPAGEPDGEAGDEPAEAPTDKPRRAGKAKS